MRELWLDREVLHPGERREADRIVPLGDDQPHRNSLAQLERRRCQMHARIPFVLCREVRSAPSDDAGILVDDEKDLGGLENFPFLRREITAYPQAHPVL